MIVSCHSEQREESKNMTTLPPHPSPLPQGARERTRAAFTLAEILITIGIIGVVAALTIPNLISTYNRIKTETQLKHIYSTILQGLRMYQAQNGDIVLDDEASETADENGYSVERSRYVFDKIFLPVFTGTTSLPKSVSYLAYSANGENNVGLASRAAFYILKNGNVIGFTKRGGSSGFAFDVILNPQKKKLISGKDFFTFMFFDDGSGNYRYGQAFGTKYDNDAGKDKLIEYCKSNSNYPADFNPPPCFCTHIIVLNNFKIPKDYPLKF